MPGTSRPVDFQTSLVYEEKYRAQGFLRIAGIDEAGRGPLAGPVVAACVILPDHPHGLHDVTDSKKVTPKKREELFPLIQEHALSIGVGIVDAPVIDQINILQATFLAMHQAFKNCAAAPDFCLIDGNQRPSWALAAETIVKGDSRSLSIAAASIIAKVTRDRLMDEYDRQYPQWQFAKHKGYGTALHMSAIQTHGICGIHRRTFMPISQMDLSFSHP